MVLWPEDMAAPHSHPPAKVQKRSQHKAVSFFIILSEKLLALLL